MGTSLGGGTGRYLVQEFTNLGTRPSIILPGYDKTTGGPPPLMAAPRYLALEGAMRLARGPEKTSRHPSAWARPPMAHGSLDEGIHRGWLHRDTAGAWPAQRASRLDPAASLSSE